MKKTILILFAVAMTSVSVMAQEQGKKAQKTPEERAENITKRLTKELALKPDQQGKIKAIILQREQERGAAMSPKERRAKKEKMDNDFKVILTPEQYTIYQQKWEEKKQKRREWEMTNPGADDSSAPHPKQ